MNQAYEERIVTPLEPGNEMPLFEMMVRYKQINRFFGRQPFAGFA